MWKKNHKNYGDLVIRDIEKKNNIQTKTRMCHLFKMIIKKISS